MRIARDLGDVSSLFPDGIKHLDQLPHTLHTAIVTALGFLRFEELPDDERPPKRIWFDPDEMRSWWAMVERKRKAEVSGDTEAGVTEERNAAIDSLVM